MIKKQLKDGKAELRFWKEAKQIIRKGYGKPCKDFTFGCAGCEANLVIAWIEKHIDLLNWEKKYEKTNK